ncbi:MAG: hypothetical protein L0H93_19920, partial [Nocardioides sp.]|nr:hypothetical protein [Nocardioides sp.]
RGARLEVALSTADGFEEPTVWFTEPEWDLYSATVTPGDIDGDGTDELVVRSTADLPKGEKAPKTTRLSLLRAGGSGFSTAGEPYDLREDIALSAPVDAGDVDGDGDAEVVAYVPGQSSARVLVMEVEDEQIQSGTTWLKRDSRGYTDLPNDRFLTDADGDGKADLVLLPSPEKRSFTVAVALSGDQMFEEPEQWTEIDCRNDPCDESWMILRSGS